MAEEVSTRESVGINRRDLLKKLIPKNVGEGPAGNAKNINTARRANTIPSQAINLDTRALSEKRTQTEYDIVFEPGLHGYGKHTHGVYYQLLDKGNFKANVWNDAAKVRIHDIGPKVLAIDSLAAGPEIYTGNNEEMPETNLPFLWTLLPGKPSDINPDGIVYVVASDQFSGNPQVLFKEGEDPAMEKALSHTGLRPPSLIRDGVDHAKRVIDDSFNLLVLAMGVSAAKIKLDDLLNTPPTRRDVIKLLGQAIAVSFGTATALKVGAELSALTAAFVKNPLGKDLLVRLADALILEEPTDEEWFNARNAGYILQTKDAMDYLRARQAISPKDKAVALAGPDHSFGINNLLDSDKACFEAIQNYSGKLFSIIDRLAKNDSSIDADQVKNNVGQLLANTNVYEVRDPVPPGPNSKKTVMGSLREAITFHHGGISPRVHRAILEILPHGSK